MSRADSRRYGVPAVQENLGEGLLRITGLLEKPTPEQAPSDYAAIGGYVVTPGIIEQLQRITDGWQQHGSGEVYLTDAINAHAAGHAVYGQVIAGHWYDTGNPADYLVAQFMSAMAHPEYGPILRELAARHATTD
jgi:UTP--glucose-1-phosphate uridylyltransferase